MRLLIILLDSSGRNQYHPSRRKGRFLRSGSFHSWLSLTQILASYDDKDRSKAKATEEKIEELKRRKEGRPAAGGNGKQGSDEGSDVTKTEDGDEKGPAVLSVDQSAITGESLAVDKYIGEIVSEMPTIDAL